MAYIGAPNIEHLLLTYLKTRTIKSTCPLQDLFKKHEVTRVEQDQDPNIMTCLRNLTSPVERYQTCSSQVEQRFT